MTHLDLGFVEIDPKTPVIAVCFTTITFTYTAGHPMNCAGYVTIVFHHKNDFGSQQLDNPSAPNFYTSAMTSRTAIKWWWDPKRQFKPFNKALEEGRQF